MNFQLLGDAQERSIVSGQSLRQEFPYFPGGKEQYFPSGNKRSFSLVLHSENLRYGAGPIEFRLWGDSHWAGGDFNLEIEPGPQNEAECGFFAPTMEEQMPQDAKRKRSGT